MLRYAENTQFVAENGPSEVVLWFRAWMDAHSADKNRQFVGTLTKIALTHWCGEIWRATASHIDWFSNTNLLPRKITPAEGFISTGGRLRVTIYSQTIENWHFGALLESKNFFRYTWVSQIWVISLLRIYSAHTARFWKSFGFTEN